MPVLPSITLAVHSRLWQPVPFGGCVEVLGYEAGGRPVGSQSGKSPLASPGFSEGKEERSSFFWARHLFSRFIQHSREWKSGSLLTKQSVMFYRNNNLKRTIGQLAIALVLLSGIQQGPAYCFLFDCHSSWVDSETTIGSVRACSCDRVCSAPSRPSVSTIGKKVTGPSRTGPCPATCWCHQAPEPLGQPASAPELVESSPQGAGMGPSLDLLAVRAASDPTLDQAAGVSCVRGPSATRRCAIFCRFLI